MDQFNLSNLNSTIYSEKKYGIWGTLGSGAGCDVHFIQMVLTSRDLDNIKLISDIPESKRWSIKDLFQRNINQSRVDNDLIEYLNDPERIKFFNPITLILLPHTAQDHIIKEVPYLSVNGEINDSTGIVFSEREYKDFYKLGFSESLQLGKFEWNRDNCFVVAIDGQHRLSALKKLNKSAQSNFKDWKIPAVLLCIHQEQDKNVKVGLLEAVRRVFIDINNKADKISEARKILLNDALVLDVVSQEIIEFAHSSNDPRRVSLVFFNWRGDQDKTKKSSFASLISVTEINTILNSYFELPREDDKNPKIPNWLANASIPSGELSYKSSSDLRKLINKDFIPAFHTFIKNISPYSSYLDELTTLFHTPTGKYCYEKDSYDTVDFFEADKENYYYSEFQQLILKQKSKIPELLNLDIGVRAIMYLYSKKNLFDKIYQIKNNDTQISSWEEHASRVSSLINALIKHHWFEYENKNTTQYKFQTGIVKSPSGTIINYRIDDVPSAFGALLLRLTFAILEIDLNTPSLVRHFEQITDELRGSYIKEIKKVKRAELSATWEKTNKELSKEVQKLATQDADKLMKEFEILISRYSTFSSKYQ